ncbi:MAG: hypothetical protein KJ879_00605 [Nanoarchaeota archaeon]|nr:hypothetical protein [Nanoarchaeota archaeon]
MDKKGKSIIILGLITVLALTTFAVVAIAHINPQGKQTHPVGLETESCQGALAGAEEQLADRGIINPRLLDNIEDKCGVECSIEFDAAHEPVLVCEEEAPQCVKVDPRNLFQGACTDLSLISELHIPQCCGFEGPQGGINCGADQEWVVGISAFPTCYISNS